MKHAEPTILTIFGITGDLTKRKLLPALYHLEQDNLLPDAFYIVGTTRRELDLDDYKQQIRERIEHIDDNCEDSVLDKLVDRIRIAQVDPAEAQAHEALKNTLSEIENHAGVCTNRLFYMAIPPEVYKTVIQLIGEQKTHVCEHGELGRLLVEKPFGRDVDSAQELVDTLNKYFTEEQIYRIDHYLAKETAQNILYFRLRNPLMRDVWSSQFVHYIQITAAEMIGIEGRVDFYEQTGALRDMIQSHLLQLLALTTMDEPEELESEPIRSQRARLLASLKPIEDVAANAVRGQYKGYRDEVNNSESVVETYASLRVEIDNDRWRGVPIYLRAGKALEQKVTEITLVYEDRSERGCDPNLLTIRIQPNEGIALKLQAKKPGLENASQDITMDYCYERSQDDIKHDAYEKLLVDSMRGDQTLFPTTDEIMTNWHFIDPILKHWHANDQGLEFYEQGSWGPTSADELLKRDDNEWLSHKLNICQPRITPPSAK